MKKTVHNIILTSVIFSFGSPLLAQDTLITNYPNTKQVWEKLFEEGRKIKETIYYENGQVWMTASYNPNKNEDWNWFHENGNPFFSAKIVDDKLQGNYQIWYENGQLAESLNFIDSIEQGEAKFWHPNGQIAIIGNYTDGRMTGEWKFFDEEGSLANGPWIWKFAALNQFTRMEGNLENGKRIGTWTYRGTAERGRDGQLEFVEEF